MVLFFPASLSVCQLWWHSSPDVTVALFYHMFGSPLECAKPAASVKFVTSEPKLARCLRSPRVAGCCNGLITDDHSLSAILGFMIPNVQAKHALFHKRFLKFPLLCVHFIVGFLYICELVNKRVEFGQKKNLRLNYSSGYI